MAPTAARLDPLAVRRELRAAGLRPQPARSQNFLADPDVLEAILDLAAPAPGDRVLEIGPGLGILTGGLLDSGAIVTAIELDAGLAALLRRRFAARIDARSLTLIEGDALDQALTAIVPPPYDVIANLPYHVTSPTLHRLLESPPRPRRLVLMLQAEVADRIAAAPGRMSYLSVFVQYHATVRVALRVPPEAFEPAPKVESAVVVIEPRTATPLSTEREADLWRLVQAGFRERRKMLRNVLPRQMPHLGEHLDQALGAAGLDGERRPQTLSVAEWIALLEALG
ncbi:MAG TPA: 16S rRNA (adenine(1518)-N(6)/adenine(1519)-N(6))-dimethyltransferase RsmA [Candidatus Limnocylindrales bacterium]|nr:16S rRNA (adenine(1518)-N(6)/adenine(1519)-N(6))-dimethyltransferase RsmA [Candidatus Limnocylindrales bacterium]